MSDTRVTTTEWVEKTVIHVCEPGKPALCGLTRSQMRRKDHFPATKWESQYLLATEMLCPDCINHPDYILWTLANV